MDIDFSKMHGLGNDFVVIDGVNQAVDLDEAQRRLIADRHLGIGCDQILLLQASTDDQHDFVYRIFNADGGEVEQCGNGARCITRFAIDHSLSNKSLIHFKTSTGSINCEALANGNVRVDMGAPKFSAQSLPFIPSLATESNSDTTDYQISVSDISIEFSIASMGNPHAAIPVENIQTAPVIEHGAFLGAHSAFPEGVNVGFMQIIDNNHIKLRVFERGAGETLACGTGACAAVAVGRRHGVLEESVRVDLPGGTLQIEWSGQDDAPLFMSGPAESVFNGKISL